MEEQIPIEERIREIEERSPVEIDLLTKEDLCRLDWSELENLEAVIESSGSRMGRSLYVVNKEGELLEGFGYGFRGVEEIPSIRRVAIPLYCTPVLGAILGFVVGKDAQSSLYAASVAGLGGLVASGFLYWNEWRIKKGFQTYLENRRED
jgi:hypothetical protein